MLTIVPEDISKADKVRRNIVDEIFILSPLYNYNTVIFKSRPSVNQETYDQQFYYTLVLNI